MTPTNTALAPLSELISLAGRRALITGAARGIGLAVARRFAEAGAALLLGDKNEAAAVQAADDIAGQFGKTAVAARLDVTDADSVAEFAALGVATLGGIDIWVNNAGIYPGSSLTDTTDEMWEEVNAVNLRGTFLGSREAARRMLATAATCDRVIINITSVAAVRGRLGLSAYSAAKSGVLGLTRGAAVELAPHRIRVLSVTPSMAETPGVQEMRESARRGQGSTGLLADMEQSIRKAFPMGRTGQADEVARVVLFCASDLAAFMTGSNIFVDGGLTST